MELPADGLVIHSVDLKCDESVMTGEPGKQKKIERNRFLFYLLNNI